MKKYLIFVLTFYLFQSALATVSFAQQWAENMFEERRHSFGSVAIGVEAVHRFKFKNPYPEDVHIASVTSSCGCTSVFWPNKPIKYGETGEITARLNTDGRFKEYKSATLTVVIDRPHRAEVQLQVTSYIRPDVVITPGNAEFGTVSEGKEVSKKLRMQYSGRSNWQLVKIERSNPNIEVRADEIERGNGRIVYDITVTMLDTMPSGYVHDIVRFVTNDNTPNATAVTLPVQGYVTAPLVAKPSPFVIGFLKPGETIKKNLVLRSETPFRITKITSQDPRFQFAVSNLEHRVHVLPITFSADYELGELTEPIVIHTSLNEHQKILLTTQGKVFHEHMFNDPKQMLAESSGVSSQQRDDKDATFFVVAEQSAAQQPAASTIEKPVEDAIASEESTMSFRVEMSASKPNPVPVSQPLKPSISEVAQNVDHTQNTAASTIVSPTTLPNIAGDQVVAAEKTIAVPTESPVPNQNTHATAGTFSVSVEDSGEIPTTASTTPVTPVTPTMPVTPTLAAVPQLQAVPSAAPANEWEELRFDVATEPDLNRQGTKPNQVAQDVFDGEKTQIPETRAGTNLETGVSTNTGIAAETGVMTVDNSLEPVFEIIAEPSAAQSLSEESTPHFENGSDPEIMGQLAIAQPPVESSFSLTPGAIETNTIALDSQMATSETSADHSPTHSGTQALVFAQPSVRNNLTLIAEKKPESADHSDAFDIIGDANNKTQTTASDDKSPAVISNEQSVAVDSSPQVPLSVDLVPRIARAVPVTGVPRVPPVHGMTPSGELLAGEAIGQRPLVPTLQLPSASDKLTLSEPTSKPMLPQRNETDAVSEEELLIASLFGSHSALSTDLQPPKQAGTVSQNMPETLAETSQNQGESQPLEMVDLGTSLGTSVDSLASVERFGDDDAMSMTARQPEVGLPPQRLQMKRIAAPQIPQQTSPQYTAGVPSDLHEADPSMSVQGIPLPRLSPNGSLSGNASVPQSPQNVPGYTAQMRMSAAQPSAQQQMPQRAGSPQQYQQQQQQLTVQQMQQQAMYQQQMQQRAMYQQMQQNQIAAAQTGRNAPSTRYPAATQQRPTTNTTRPQQQQQPQQQPLVLPPAPVPSQHKLMTPAPVFR